jgi:DNA-binding NarL/FixJ family response regulator
MNILIVDKSDQIRSLIKNIIFQKDSAAKIYESQSNEEAISLVERYKPKYMITDTDLVNGTGLSLISFTETLSPKTKIIVLTWIRNNLRLFST